MVKPKLSETHKQYWLENEIAVDKIKPYAALIGTSETNFLRMLVNDFFKDKIVTKDYIELENPYYFNMKELLTSGTVKAYLKQPLEDRINTYAIYLVPNNLDDFNNEIKSCCYGNNASLHRGIYIHYDLKNKPVPIPLIFDYDSKVKEITIVNVKLEDLIDYAEKEEDYIVINNILESIKSPKEDKFEENYKVIMNVGRLNRVGLAYELGNAEGLENIKELISNPINHVKASEINNPVEVIIGENEEKNNEIKELNSKLDYVEKTIFEIDKKKDSPEEIIKKIQKNNKDKK